MRECLSRVFAPRTVRARPPRRPLHGARAGQAIGELRSPGAPAQQPGGGADNGRTSGGSKKVFHRFVPSGVSSRSRKAMPTILGATSSWPRASSSRSTSTTDLPRGRFAIADCDPLTTLTREIVVARARSFIAGLKSAASWPVGARAQQRYIDARGYDIAN